MDGQCLYQVCLGEGKNWIIEGREIKEERTVGHSCGH